MKSPEIVRQVRQVPITDYLASINVLPAYQTGGQLFYCSPKTNEKSPSLAVQPEKNVFYDWSGEGKGDVLSLVQYLNGCTFLEAVQILETYLGNPLKTSFSFSGRSYKADSTGVTITNVKPLSHLALKQYVEQRGLSYKVASRYLREIHYQTNGKQCFALGFPLVWAVMKCETPCLKNPSPQRLFRPFLLRVLGRLSCLKAVLMGAFQIVAIRPSRS